MIGSCLQLTARMVISRIGAKRFFVSRKGAKTPSKFWAAWVTPFKKFENLVMEKR